MEERVRDASALSGYISRIVNVVFNKVDMLSSGTY